jgi:hypothetical protein
MKQKNLAERSSKKTVTNFAFGSLFALGVLALLLCAILWPLASIWALNQMFGFSIGYTFWNWLAAWILIMTFQGAINVRNTKRR